MGKKARQRRSEEKQLGRVLDFTLERTARMLGFKENELGELKKRITKAEARRWFLRQRAVCAEMLESVRNFDPSTLLNMGEVRLDLLNQMSHLVAQDIDREVLASL